MKLRDDSRLNEHLVNLILEEWDVARHYGRIDAKTLASAILDAVERAIDRRTPAAPPEPATWPAKEHCVIRRSGRDCSIHGPAATLGTAPAPPSEPKP